MELDTIVVLVLVFFFFGGIGFLIWKNSKVETPKVVEQEPEDIEVENQAKPKAKRRRKGR